MDQFVEEPACRGHVVIKPTVTTKDTRARTDVSVGPARKLAFAQDARRAQTNGQRSTQVSSPCLIRYHARRDFKFTTVFNVVPLAKEARPNSKAALTKVLSRFRKDGQCRALFKLLTKRWASRLVEGADKSAQKMTFTDAISQPDAISTAWGSPSLMLCPLQLRL